LEFNKLLENKNVSFIEIDLIDKNQFTKLDKYDFVYHLAAINGTENFYKIPDKVLKVGTIGTINMLDWFIQNKKGKFLFSSSSETYAGTLKLLGKNFPIPTPEEIPLTVEDPSNPRWSYGAGKIISEVAVHCYNHIHDFDFSIVRYHNIYGPRMGTEHVMPQFIKRILKKENPFKIFGGKETRAFCFIDDAVQATKLVMENPKANKKTFHIGRSDEEIKIIDLAKMLFEIAGTNPEIKTLPAPKGSVKRRCPDVSKLSALGFKPEVKLKEGLLKIFEWYQEYFAEN
ncbi:NAD-dependent epimerase/dehydratase family protein, partial [Candidatus Micrarchaeota archaeon]|nr:NAD-dependent epimerase/dehydratase family protein [Candidatus Micrarchaeota archaeon]